MERVALSDEMVNILLKGLKIANSSANSSANTSSDTYVNALRAKTGNIKAHFPGRSHKGLEFQNTHDSVGVVINYCNLMVGMANDLAFGERDDGEAFNRIWAVLTFGEFGSMEQRDCLMSYVSICKSLRNHYAHNPNDKLEIHTTIRACTYLPRMPELMQRMGFSAWIVTYCRSFVNLVLEMIAKNPPEMKSWKE